jgi:hypothetical protein
LTAVTAQGSDSMQIEEKRIVLHVLNDLQANAEYADTLFSELKIKDKIINGKDSVILFQMKMNEELLWQRDNLIAENERKDKKIKFYKTTTFAFLLLSIILVF